jgi:hypothetical protein
MTEAVTKSLAERLERVRMTRKAGRNMPERVKKLAKRIATCERRASSSHPSTKNKLEWRCAHGSNTAAASASAEA